MLLKSNRKAKYHLPAGELNIVSLMDIITMLLFFLVAVVNLTKFAIIPATALPTGASAAAEKPKPTFALQVTVFNEATAYLWLGPIRGLRITNRNSLAALLQTGFRGNEELGYLKKLTAPAGKQIYAELQNHLVQLKLSFPSETKAVVAFTDTITYQQLIDAVETIRSLAPDRESFVASDIFGRPEKTRVLFPEILILEDITFNQRSIAGG